jgi:HEAT repeat protein
MGMKRSYLLIVLIFVMSFRAAGLGAEKSALTAGAGAEPAEVKPDEQLDIFKNALLNDPNDQIRTKAASVMLFGENLDARKFLLDTLKQSKNSAARIAVCKALFQTRSSKEPVKNKEDFIQPLLAVFDTENDAEAQSAAEATLIFEYEKIGKLLEDLATDTSKPVKTRLNALRALRLRPDMDATIRLIRLVDDADKQVASAAEEALRSLSIPVGRDAPTRRQIIQDLKAKGKDAFLRDWLIRQETLIREIRAEADFWRTSYLTALGKMYGTLTDDAAKGAFLEEHLRSPKAEVRLWALERAYEWRVAPGTRLPEKLGPVLISLISDRERAVRLKIAAVLPVMGEVNSAQPLLAQLEAEQDDEVATELFGALGDACYIAFLPNSTIKIPVEIRQQTLEWAAKFLADPAPTRVRKGAEVMRKLLGQNGLTAAESERYLALLADRYNGLKSGSDGAVRGELLNAMASLCAPQSVHKAQAKKQFGALFEAALSDKTDFVREVAVDGLTYIDKTAALKLLRKDYVNDPSLILRKKLIALADESGGKDDLNWLSDKIGANAEGEPAWQAMLKILKDLKDTDPAAWRQWADKLTAADSKLTNEQKIAFLKTAETSGVSEYKPEARKKLAELYYTTGQFELAADYFNVQYEAAKTAEEKEAVLPKLLDASLRSSKQDRLVVLVGSYLSKSDLELNSTIRQSINDYLSQPPAGADPDALLKVLEGMKIPQGRTKWHQWLNGWKARLAKNKELSKPQQTGN